MSQQPANPPIPSTDLDPSHPLLTNTFRSILPNLDQILQVLLEQGTSETPPKDTEASAQVAKHAREMASALAEMREAALSMPGGAYSTEAIQRMTRVLEAEAEKRRAILLAFGARDMPCVEEAAKERRTGEESVMPSPATRAMYADEQE